MKGIKKIVFIPSFSTHAYVCVDGSIYIQWILGRMFDKKQFVELVKKEGFNEEFLNSRIEVYDDIEKWVK